MCNSILLEYEQKSGCVADIVGCALAIIRSPTLSYVFTSKYEFLVCINGDLLFLFFHNKCFIDDSKTAIVHVIISQVKFLRNVLLLIIRTIQDDRVVPPEYVQLLQKCISAYSVSQRAQAQQEKVCLSIFLISSF